MASSGSLSQESLDYEDYNVSSRRSRAVRVARGRLVPPVYSRMESLETTDDNGTTPCVVRQPVEAGAGAALITSAAALAVANCDHDSPTRARVREKQQRCWPSGHAAVIVHKAKANAAKDKRKLREKRRSSGLVHIQSTESTGDSMDENEKELDRSNIPSEFIDADNPQTPEEDRRGYGGRTIRNKSPSDLDADLEDNQDYDSTVSQSEANSSRTHSATTLQTITSLTPRRTDHHDELTEKCSVQKAACVAEKSPGIDLQQMLMKEREENLRLQELLRNKEHTIAVLEMKISELVKHQDV